MVVCSQREFFYGDNRFSNAILMFALPVSVVFSGQFSVKTSSNITNFYNGYCYATSDFKYINRICSLKVKPISFNILIPFMLKKRNRTSSKYIYYYALKLYFSGPSLRKTSERLSNTF